MWRVLLIAEREFRAYATTASFWVALVMGPLLLGLAAMSMGGLDLSPAPRTVSIQADRPDMGEMIAATLNEAASLEGRELKLQPAGSAADMQVTAVDGTVRVAGGKGFTALEQALLKRDLYGADLAKRLHHAGVKVPPRPPVAAPAPHAAKPRIDAGGAMARFAPVFLLWLTLIGALGMLLQSVVRERANRALEHLLAGARPAEIVFGKLLGVGAVSLLVLAGWLAAGAALASTPLGAAPTMLSGLSDPGAIAYAAAVYVMAFLLYGSALVCVGAFASDLPTAQNMSRPVFGLLVVIFFLAMGSVMGFGSQLSWLIWLPPFTPFMLLLSPEGALSIWQQIALWTLMAASTVAITTAASRTLIISPRPLWAKRPAAAA